MKTLSRLLIGSLGLVLFAGVAAADIAIPTETNVFFYMDGEPVTEVVDYEVSCQGWSTGMPDDELADPDDFFTDPTEEVYTYSASCEEFGCAIDENYYMNYRVIDSCSLTAEVDGETYELSDYNDTPIPPVERNGDPNDRLYYAFFDLVDGMMVYMDVAPDHVNYDAVRYISQRGIVNGYDDGTYKASNTLNRAEFVKILMLSEYASYEVENCDTEEYGFSDVPEDEWFAPYVCMAKQEGVISGYSDGTFKPSQAINFVEAAKIAVEVISVPDGDDDYDELEEGEEWYDPYVDVLEEAEAVPESVDDFGSSITRGEMAEIVYGLLLEWDVYNAELESTDA